MRVSIDYIADGSSRVCQRTGSERASNVALSPDRDNPPAQNNGCAGLAGACDNGWRMDVHQSGRQETQAEADPSDREKGQDRSQETMSIRLLWRGYRVPATDRFRTLQKKLAERLLLGSASMSVSGGFR